jgi:hypothetical protein
MPNIGEWMTPWIASAFLVAVLSVTYVVGGRQLPVLEQTLLAISLCATLTAASLVILRSSRAQKEAAREERARPPAEALDGGVVRLGTLAYAQAMERWTGTVLELLEHAQGCAEEGSPEAAELATAVTDTRELRELLESSTTDDLDINAAATVHALCSLWETNEPRIEELAASCDPAWHRRWSARSVADRRLRHGGTVSAPLVIPYRT